ncbi:hypothetical protein LTSEMIN_5832, partial [Salmonella enterica subsp. enterica serovar Minnesota str. A4-603]
WWMAYIKTTERNLLTFNRASAEEIQDHSCAILSSR